MQKTSHIINKIYDLINYLIDYFTERNDIEAIRNLAEIKQIIKNLSSMPNSTQSNDKKSPLVWDEENDIETQEEIISEVIKYFKNKIKSIKNPNIEMKLSNLITFLEESLLKKANNINKIYKYAQNAPTVQQAPMRQRQTNVPMQQQQMNVPMQQNNMQGQFQISPDMLKINQLSQYTLKQLLSDRDPKVRKLVEQILNLLSSRI